MSRSPRISGTTLTTIVLGLVAVVSLIALVWWLKPPIDRPDTTQTTQTADVIAPAADAVSSPVPTLSPAGTVDVQRPNSASQQDVAVNCQLLIDPNGALRVNRQTRDCFEFFITQYGEKSVTQIDQDFQRYILAGYQPPASQQIIELWGRYLKYREALGQLQPPEGYTDPAKQNAAYFRQIDQSMQNVRKRFFSAVEIEGMFGDEDTYQQYTLARMAILEDDQLSPAEKAAKLKALFATLPSGLQEQLQQIQTLDNLHRLTAEIKTNGGSAADIRQMRTSLVGAEATARLEQLDQQRSSWRSRVTTYLQARDQIRSSGMADSAKNQAINQLRQQHFPQASEALRVQTFEHVHDQGGTLP